MHASWLKEEERDREMWRSNAMKGERFYTTPPNRPRMWHVMQAENSTQEKHCWMAVQTAPISVSAAAKWGINYIPTKTSFNASGRYAQHTLGRVDRPIGFTLQPEILFAASTHIPIATIFHVVDNVSARFDLLLPSAALKDWGGMVDPVQFVLRYRPLINQQGVHDTAFMASAPVQTSHPGLTKPSCAVVYTQNEDPPPVQPTLAPARD